jgi:hypothetical protein
MLLFRLYAQVEAGKAGKKNDNLQDYISSKCLITFLLAGAEVTTGV